MGIEEKMDKNGQKNWKRELMWSDWVPVYGAAREICNTFSSKPTTPTIVDSILLSPDLTKKEYYKFLCWTAYQESIIVFPLLDYLFNRLCPISP